MEERNGLLASGPFSFSTVWLCDRLMYGEQLFEHALQLVQAQCIRAIGLRMRGIVVNFEEDSVDTGGHGRARQHWNEFRLAT